MKQLFAALARVGVALAVCAGSISVAIIAFPLADYRSSGEHPLRHETVAVLSRTTRRTSPAMVELEWSPSHQAKVGDASGKVTEVFISAGIPVECGAPVIAIDGGARLAMCGRVPPWRDVTSSTKGADADQLADLLVGLKLLSEEDRANGARRAAAWKNLARFIGLPTPAVFHPSDIVWVGERSTPSRVSVQVGDRVAGDSTLYEVDAVLQAATVHSSSGDGVTATDWVFSIEGSGVEFPILSGGSLDGPAFESTARSTVTEIDAALPTRIQGLMRLASPVSYAAIPPSALVTAPDGSICVVLAEGGTAPVTIVETTTGLVMVDAPLTEGSAIRDLPPAGTTC